MLMHMCAGHVTLLLREFHPSKFLPQSDLGRRADSRWALPQISSLFLKRFLLVCPETLVSGANLCFTADVFFSSFQREISEMRQPIGVKFCTVIITKPNFIVPVQNFGAHPQKN